MKIIEYASHRAKAITDLFYESVSAIDECVYSAQQKQAWAPKPIDYVKWATRLEGKRPYIALINERVAGFIELASDGHIDCAYVSPEFQRKGVATSLLNHVVHVARIAGLTHLYVEASIVAKPLFEKNGFLLVSQNEVIRQDIVLINYSMRLAILR